MRLAILLVAGLWAPRALAAAPSTITSVLGDSAIQVSARTAEFLSARGHFGKRATTTSTTCVSSCSSTTRTGTSTSTTSSSSTSAPVSSSSSVHTTSSASSSLASSTTSSAPPPLPTSYVDFGIPFTGIQEPKHGVTYGFILPPGNSTEFVGEIIAPIANQWVGVALGGPNSLMVVGWPNDTQIFGSPRYIDAGFNAQEDDAVNVTTISSSVNETHWSWVYRCENCTAWLGGSLAVNGTQTMTWLIGLQPVLTPDADNSTLSGRSDTGSWQQNLAAAHNVNYPSFALGSTPSWTRRTMFPSTSIGQSKYGPAMTTHAGGLWISGVTNSQALWYANGTNTAFAQSTTNVNNEMAAEGPALAEFADVLHLVFPDKVSGNLVHLQFNDTTATWGQRLVLNFTTSGPPALTVFNGSLVLAYMNSKAKNQLHVAQWDPANGWSPAYDLGGAPLSWGTPALYTLGNQIYILFPANNSGRKVLALTATQVNGTWNPTAAPNESTAYGTSAATYEITAIMAFQSNNGKGQLFASIFNGFSWAPHEDTGQTTSHTPAVTVLDGIANCIFSSHDSTSTVLWVQRQMSLSPLRAWMASLDGTLLLSEMSIPGTHDSASVTTFPFTATQELSIFEQLLMGVRFLDLRCTLVDNILQMYHGSISLDTTLELMLAQIYTFLSSSTQEAIIVSIKQESDPIGSNITFDAALSQLIGQQSQSWNLSTTIPQLQDIRGKIQLVRRYKTGSIGIDASNWPNNVPTFTAPQPNGALVVEDFYDFDLVIGLDSIISNKTNLLLGALTAAQTDPVNTNWYLSFSSASNTPFNMPKGLAVGAMALVPPPPHFVVGINQRLASYLFSLLGSAPKVGTVLMDFVDTPGGGALVEAIVSLNG